MLKKKKLLIGVGIAVAVIGFTTVGVLQSDANQSFEVDLIQPQKEMMKDEVMIPGEVELAETETISIRPGEEHELLVEEGDVVEEGNPLLEYTSDDLDFESDQLALQKESSYLRINQVDKQQKRLDDKKEELEKEMSKADAAQMIEEDREQLDYEKRAANLELRQLLLQEEQLEKQATERIVKSPVAGTIVTINKGADPQMTIASVDQFTISGYVSEYDSLVIKEGQEVAIQSDAILDKEWTGAVMAIDFLPEQGEADSSLRYPLTVSFESGDTSDLRPGYQVILNVVTEERESLSLPFDAVVQNDEMSYVYVVEDGIAVMREVELGMTSDGSFEIRSGLSETDQVVAEVPTGLSDGGEVTVRD
ncbi:efflux RND transporter periplasmic adaptor subunit [Alkalihalophilus lindianensis]|uniref:Efflux RND transporter periplasmic adaptor subunit n=1 Tax=Alkalihalophilus lindianensis TaxID=1630542 RepID=A0ABU3X4J2_9BACI|nr:efflux RND transporter periplasmic adaptor subunit [Alkalihalophilus lindianensis]MDV2682811.1 efflux RND transporter periplasmic adaptor subunit [Alkalihalophilus lindianensis]